jgi:hypothetical protein
MTISQDDNHRIRWRGISRKDAGEAVEEQKDGSVLGDGGITASQDGVQDEVDGGASHGVWTIVKAIY